MATPPPPFRFVAAAFDRYLARLAGRTFGAVRWLAPTGATAWADDRPVLAVANHTGWWDGFIAHQLTRAMGAHFHVLMEREHLDRYPFFRRVGALSMERRLRRAAWRDLAGAARVLVPGRWLWIFPQGARRPAAEPIGALEGGAGWLVASHRGPLRVVPCAFRYPFLGEQRPEALALLGEPWTLDTPVTDRRAAADEIARRLRDTVAALDRRLLTEDLADFATPIAGRPSINTRLDAVRYRVGMLDRPPAPN